MKPVRRCTSLNLENLPPAPIPPSLIASPYLSSPIFNTEGPPSNGPDEQDELWLGDTVPVQSSPDSPCGNLRLSDLKKLHIPSESRRPAPPSPPIIINSPARSPTTRAYSQFTQSMNPNHPPNHPSNFTHYHHAPSHLRTLPLPHPHSPLAVGPQYFNLHPSPPIPGCSRPSWGAHMRMRSDSDLALVARQQARSTRVDDDRLFLR